MTKFIDYKWIWRFHWFYNLIYQYQTITGRDCSRWTRFRLDLILKASFHILTPQLETLIWTTHDKSIIGFLMAVTMHSYSMRLSWLSYFHYMIWSISYIYCPYHMDNIFHMGHIYYMGYTIYMAYIIYDHYPCIWLRTYELFSEARTFTFLFLMNELLLHVGKGWEKN